MVVKNIQQNLNYYGWEKNSTVSNKSKWNFSFCISALYSISLTSLLNDFSVGPKQFLSNEYLSEFNQLQERKQKVKKSTSQLLINAGTSRRRTKHQYSTT
jgi:hypothetical protein